MNKDKYNYYNKEYNNKLAWSFSKEYSDKLIKKYIENKNIINIFNQYYNIYISILKSNNISILTTHKYITIWITTLNTICNNLKQNNIKYHNIYTSIHLLNITSKYRL